MPPASAAVVVAWREAQITRDAMASIAAMQPTVDKMVVVVQEWRPEEVAALEDEFGSTALVLAIDRNIGFSEAANMGIDAAVDGGAEWILLVNNDATVTADCLACCLAEAALHPRLAVLGPAVVFADSPNRLWYVGATQSERFAFTRHPGLQNDASTLPPSGPTGYVPGCCALVSAAAWKDVGPYRVDFFLYYEDADWCSRARAKGWEVRYLAKVLCHHAVSVTAGKRGSLGLTETSAYYLARNPLRWALGTAKPFLRLTRSFGILLVWGGYNAGRVVQSRSLRVARAYLSGTVDAFGGSMGRRSG